MSNPSRLIPNSSQSTSSSYSNHLKSTYQPIIKSIQPDLDPLPLCRVCLSDDPSLGPLFHPCRCTGSIAHVHEECLSTWLSRSKKLTCELCGYHFSFEKVYKPGSPIRPPLSTIFLQALKEILRLFLFITRTLLVAICWLAIVPWAVVRVSTAYWKAADWFAFGIISSNPLHQNSFQNSSSSINLNLNSTDHQIQSTSNQKFLHFLSKSQFNSTITIWLSNFIVSLNLDLNSIALDIFQGQLITCAIILSFVIVFLLREWIIQNTPPADVMRLAEDEIIQNHHQPPPQHQDLNQIHHHIPLQPDSTIQSHHQSNLSLHQPHQPHQASSNFLQLSPSSFNHPTQLIKLNSNSFATPRIISSQHLNQANSELLFHQTLATSFYLVFTSHPSDAPLLNALLESSHLLIPSDPRLKLLNILIKLAQSIVLHSSDVIPHSVQQFREYIASSSTSSANPSTSNHIYQELEFQWTNALLNDLKLLKQIQYTFKTQSSSLVFQSQAEVKRNILLYSLLSSYILMENRHRMGDFSLKGFKAISNSLESYQIYDALCLFLLPLLNFQSNQDTNPEISELQSDLHQIIQQFLSAQSIKNHQKNSSIYVAPIETLKKLITKILVKHNLIQTLISGSTFHRYVCSVAFNNNSFTNYRSQSTRFSFSNNSKINFSHDLIEGINQLMNLKKSQEIYVKSNKKSNLKHENSIHDLTFERKILMTGFYLLSSSESQNPIPILQNVNFINFLNHKAKEKDKEALLLKLWLTLVDNCTTLSNETLQRFRKHLLFQQTESSFESDELRHFKRLEIDWFSQLLTEPLIIKLIISNLNLIHSSAKFQDQINQILKSLILKLIYIFTLLATFLFQLDSQLQQQQIIQSSFHFLFDHDHNNLIKILKQDLIQLKQEFQFNYRSENSFKVSQMIHQLENLLKSLKSLNHYQTLNNHRDYCHDLKAFSLLIQKIKVEIVEILIHQRVLCTVIQDQKFVKVAHKMLHDPNLFFQYLLPSVSNLGQFKENEEDLNNSKIDKGKGKLIAGTINEDNDKIKELKTQDVFGYQAQSINQSLIPDQLENADLSIKSNDLVIPVNHPTLDPQISFADSILQTDHSLSLKSQVPPMDETNPSLPSSQPLVDQQLQVESQLVKKNSKPTENNETSLVENHVVEQAQDDVLPEPVPQPMARDGIRAIGNGLAEGLALDDLGANAVDDEMMAEDIDGILELIGMKGSLLMLAQNVGLMTILLSLSLLAFVHLPHMIGKITVFSRAHRLLTPPLKGLLILQRFVHRLLDYTSDYVRLRLLQSDQFTVLIERFWTLIGMEGKSAQGFPRLINQSFIKKSLELAIPLINQVRQYTPRLTYFRTLWYQSVEFVGDQLNSIAYGSKPMDRTLTVLLGYFELVLLSLLYLSSGLDQQRARFVSETIVKGMQQQILIAKVGIFIFVELVIFPFLCGLLLNLTTIPIFVNASIANRIELYSSAPYSATLITWLGGTCFMFTFAILVSTCRESLRAGVCWWIRDPSDDRFNPIREILERPAWNQIKKISASAVMYGAVIVFGLGSVVFGLIFFTGSLPLRIHADRPLSSSAFDLVAYQTLLPIFLAWFQPQKKLKESLQAISRYIARKLRLTCYLYGERCISEETTWEVVVYYVQGEIKPIGRLEKRSRLSPMRLFETYQFYWKSFDINSVGGVKSKIGVTRRRKPAGGSFARVPASDSVKVVPGRKMHIPVHADGTPIDPADAAIIEQQQAETRDEVGEMAGDQYTIVYLPPHFKARLTSYVVLMWIATVVVGWQMIGIPLLVGRLILDRVIMPYSREPHDVYAYAVGIVVCAMMMVLGEKALRGYRWFGGVNDEVTSPSDIGEEIGAKPGWWRLLVSKFKDTLELSFFVLGVGIILPILMSIVVELYILGPIKPKSPGLPTLYALESWTYGCIYLSIAARLIRIKPNWVSTAQDEVMTSWEEGKILVGIKHSNRMLIKPFMIRMALSIIIPSLVFGTMMVWVPDKRMKWIVKLIGFKELDRVETFYLVLKSIYPMILSWYSNYLTTKIFLRIFKNWLEKVRDEKYLEKQGLKNYDPTANQINLQK
ncbi:hypothetical protein O181_016047 [Austropuccinia psidii MF-1]|uniref:RING-type E3 ubiquitin transferase n=1 Tax=Austropuccinia psidii MF-1 TaxID=1389203 RepID=A0A9Q3C389_9BASI|nr:hypothetical protein [Austropuccinia psidii MF-1]